MNDIEPEQSVRDIKNEGQKGLIKGASLIIILIYAFASHIPLLDLIGIKEGASSMFGLTVTWLLLLSNIYVVIFGYVLSRWMATGPNGPETMRKWFEGKGLRYLAMIAFAWLSVYWLVL